MAKASRKHIVRVVLSPQHKELLDRICQKLGQSESETLRIAFLEYAQKYKPHNRKSAQLTLCFSKTHNLTTIGLSSTKVGV